MKKLDFNSKIEKKSRRLVWLQLGLLVLMLIIVALLAFLK